MITPTIIAGTPCTINVHIDTVPVRIDTFLSHTFPQYSRSFFKRLIEEGCIIRNNFVVQKESVLVKPDDSITITIPALRDRRAIIQAAAACRCIIRRRVKAKHPHCRALPQNGLSI